MMKHRICFGALLLALLCSCGNTGGKTKTVSTPSLEPVSKPAPQVRRYGIRVVREYPHDVTSYTQGLFFHDGNLYESTGQYGRSTFRLVDLETGAPQRKLDFGKKYFVEGSTVLDDNLYILTWESRVAFVYDAATLQYKASYRYPREGWGLTTDGTHLIASDGSAQLYFMDTKFVVRKTLSVRMNGRAVANLNELEYIDGKIWANVYMTDLIVVIDPETGYVEAAVDCSGLLPDRLRTPDTDVLNGIAYQDGRLFLTGKDWPRLYEVELIEK